VKNIGLCKFNSLWIARCFGKPALEEVTKLSCNACLCLKSSHSPWMTMQVKDKAVICSGSTLGSYVAIDNYITTMLTSMDKVKCWLKGIESDQGYQNYLFYNGYFNVPNLGNATLNMQGEGVVNTIGAMNGFRCCRFSFYIYCFVFINLVIFVLITNEYNVLLSVLFVSDL
jgi:hypothetical protein